MQHRVSDQPAFIIRRREWRNSSLLLDLFTRDHGCIRVMARGARRNPAKTAFQPFELLSVGWSGKAELKTLSAIEAVSLAVDEDNYLALLYVNELIAAMLPAGEANPGVFGDYLELLQVASLRMGEAELRQFEQKLLRHLGYLPDLNVDADSGVPLEPQSFYQFFIGKGFVACDQSSADAVSGRVVLDWLEQRYQHDAVLRLAKSVLRSTIDDNLHGKTLKSREVLRAMTRAR